ncbi:MAG: Flp family type IVb pilin [Hyphomicrobiaceae bacterium]|nr:MAG: Flp family type IVb pilin [Hyphomicrobiaceae bacterium]
MLRAFAIAQGRLQEGLAAARRLAACNSGATSIEYGMIVALIFLAIVTAVTAVASKTSAMFTTVAATMSNAA